ncbi:MAG: ComF family protein [Nitrospiria bacterium]
MFITAARQLILFTESILSLIYPRSCVSCKRSIPPVQKETNFVFFSMPLFCEACASQIRRMEDPLCPVCAVPFQSNAALSSSPGHLCGDCRSDRPSFSRAVTPYVYDGPLAEAIRSFKYHRQNNFSKYFAELLWPDISALRVDLVMAIPLHISRLRIREFNQSLLLAKWLSCWLGAKLMIDGMRRVRKTRPQVGLSKKERMKNIRGSFILSRPEGIQKKRILLVDDVYTTGATLKEGAKILIQNGASEVIVTAAARMI